MSSRLLSPAQSYIRYLSVHPDKYTTADIKERLIDEGLDFISTGYLDRVRKKMPPPPRPFYPTDPYHRPSFEYICEQQINRMFVPDSMIRVTKQLVTRPRVKEQIEAMVINGQPYARIASAVTTEYKVYCTADAVGLFVHYFWDIMLLDLGQLRLLLELRSSFTEQSIPEFKGKGDALKRAYYKDPRRIAADMPRSPCGATATQLALGISPPMQSVVDRLEEIAQRGLHRSEQAAQSAGLHAAEEYSMWLSGAYTCVQIAQLIAKPNDSLKGLNAIALRTDSTPVPTIHQLSQGNHTVDILPTKENNNDDDDGDDEIIVESGEPDGGERAEGSNAAPTPPVHEG